MQYVGRHSVSPSQITVEHVESAPAFTRWALEALRCDVTPAGENIWQANLPEDLQAQWDGPAALRFGAVSNGRQGDGASPSDVLSAGASSKLFRWTVERLQASGPAIHAEPTRGPRSVHEFTPQLFTAYDFPDGHIHLAGCSLEDRAVMRLTYAAAKNGSADELRHCYLWPDDGEGVSAERIAALHLTELQPCDPPVNQASPPALEASIAAAKRQHQRADAEVVAVTVIWCKYAIGKLALGVADEGVDDIAIPFEGWAAELADGSKAPPPFHCPHSGTDSYRLAVTDDGRIAAAEAVAKCESSGQRVLVSELETCAATGKKVRSDLLESCLASGQRVLASEIVRCGQCDQPVSPSVLKGGRCSACRSLAPIGKDDPRMARLLDVYPNLDRWSRWRISETESTYVLVATSWLRQLLLVVDKESLEVTRIAAAGRFFSAWQELPSGQREELLG